MELLSCLVVHKCKKSGCPPPIREKSFGLKSLCKDVSLHFSVSLVFLNVKINVKSSYWTLKLRLLDKSFQIIISDGSHGIFSILLQSYPQRMTLQRRQYGIYNICFFIKLMVSCNCKLICFFFQIIK